jgi:hypothetical protein
MTTLAWRRLAAPALAAVLVACVVIGSGGHAPASVIRIGAVFPVTSNAASLAGPELAGVRIAADLVNADGGVDGHPIELVERDLPSREAADGVMRSLRADGVQLVIGAYSSDLSIAASEAADHAGLLYWEAGAVADQLTGRGLPMTFRTCASPLPLPTTPTRPRSPMRPRQPPQRAGCRSSSGAPTTSRHRTGRGSCRISRPRSRTC